MAVSKSQPIPVWAYGALFLAFCLFYSWSLGALSKPVWDEHIYVRVARAYVQHLEPLPNPEHPPLVKQGIAAGIRLLGDRPEAWRLFSVLGGVLANLAAIYLVDRLGKRRGVSLFIAACLLLDPLLFVHYRMAILEAPLAGWLVGALALALSIERGGPHRAWRLLLLGLVMGLGLASKWTMATAFPSIFFLVIWGLRRDRAPAGHWWMAAFALILLPCLVYFASYAALGFSPRQIWQIQLYALDYHRHYQLTVNIGSPWYEWLYSGQPLWYIHYRLDHGQARALMAVGNLVLWISAQALALYGLWAHRRSAEIWAVAAALIFQFLLFASKPLTFMHYMVAILPLLYVLMGTGIATLFDRFGDRYRRILQVDFALLLVGALLVTWNYAPFLWAWPVPQERLRGLSRTYPAETPQP